MNNPYKKPVTMTERILGFLLFITGFGFAISIIPLKIIQEYFWVFATINFPLSWKIVTFIVGIIVGILGWVMMKGANPNIR